VRWGDFEAAKDLIDAGIDINKARDPGYTEVVKLLIDRGADGFALSEGDAPFATARLGGHDNICH